jgi:hypothetical protein
MANARRHCRHCGNRAALQKGGGAKKGQYYVRCKDFNCFSDFGGGIKSLTFYPTKEEAEEAWNKTQDA